MEKARETYNNAPLDIKKFISNEYGYGDLLVEYMNGLETSKILPGLWLGTMGDAGYEPFRQSIGVTHVLNVAAEAQPPIARDIETLCLPLRDSEEQAKSIQKRGFKTLMKGTKFIHDALTVTTSQRLLVVLVHCVQGISRSGAFVVAYLMEYKGFSMDEAVLLVKQNHPGALKPFRFQEMLRGFSHFLAQQNNE